MFVCEEVVPYKYVLQMCYMLYDIERTTTVSPFV